MKVSVEVRVAVFSERLGCPELAVGAGFKPVPTLFVWPSRVELMRFGQEEREAVGAGLKPVPTLFVWPSRAELMRVEQGEREAQISQKRDRQMSDGFWHFSEDPRGNWPLTAYDAG